LTSNILNQKYLFVNIFGQNAEPIITFTCALVGSQHRTPPTPTPTTPGTPSTPISTTKSNVPFHAASSSQSPLSPLPPNIIENNFGNWSSLLTPSTPVQLKREPENPVDRHAIAVYRFESVAVFLFLLGQDWGCVIFRMLHFYFNFCLFVCSFVRSFVSIFVCVFWSLIDCWLVLTLFSVSGDKAGYLPRNIASILSHCLDSSLVELSAHVVSGDGNMKLQTQPISGSSLSLPSPSPVISPSQNVIDLDKEISDNETSNMSSDSRVSATDAWKTAAVLLEVQVYRQQTITVVDNDGSVIVETASEAEELMIQCLRSVLDQRAQLNKTHG
jgi:hypothetical protein